MLDYKDVRFSFANRRARRRRRWVRLGLLALILLAGTGFYLVRYDGIRVERAAQALLRGQAGEAGRRLSEAERWPLHPDRKAELHALLDLDAGRAAEAKARWRRLDPRGGGLPRGDLLRWLADRARYRELLAYCDFLLPAGGDETLLAAALAQAALYRPGESEACLARLSSGFQREQVNTVLMLRKFNRELRRGRFAFVFDCRNRPLAYYDVARRASQPAPEVGGFDFSAFGASMADGARFYSLTLDGNAQRLVEPLFRSFPGTFVLLDLEDNAIVAAYSRSGEGVSGNAAFWQEYEPASIVKTATLLAYLRRGVNDVFPFTCRGNLGVGKQIFYDWIPHRLMTGPEQALALSCNLVFARIGLLAGYDRLAENLRLFGFDGASWRDQFLEFRRGRFRRPAGEWELCNLAVGLREISVTTIQAAMMASLIARDGETSPPYLIGSVKNVLMLGCYAHQAASSQSLRDDLSFLKLKKAMLEVVESESGTARRARLDSVQLAVKTGTAGGAGGRMDAVLIGFFPYNRPRYAFAFRLEGGGRAELNGALLLREFLTRFLQP